MGPSPLTVVPELPGRPFRAAGIGPAVCLAMFACACARTDPPDTTARAADLASAGPEAAAEAINDIDDEVAQLALLEALFIGHGDRFTRNQLCDRLASPGTRERCNELSRRPHLYLRGPSSEDSRVATDRSHCGDDCLGQDTPLRCAVRAAEEAVEAADAEPGRSCLCLEDARMRWECLFQTAEALVLARGILAYPTALELCESSGDFRVSCDEHLVQRLATPAPPLVGDGSEGWGERGEVARAIRRVHVQIAPREAARSVDRYWSAAFVEAFRDGVQVSPDLLGSLSKVARRHLRAALAWRLLELDTPRPADLEAQVEWLGRALAGEDVLGDVDSLEPASYAALRQAPPPPRSPETPEPIRYLNVDERAWSEDPAADLAICLLEASARLYPDRLGLLEQGGASEHAAVRRTAEHLLLVISSGDTPQGPGPMYVGTPGVAPSAWPTATPAPSSAEQEGVIR